jgi:hypothetical protein
MADGETSVVVGGVTVGTWYHNCDGTNLVQLDYPEAHLVVLS